MKCNDIPVPGSYVSWCTTVVLLSLDLTWSFTDELGLAALPQEILQRLSRQAINERPGDSDTIVVPAILPCEFLRRVEAETNEAVVHTLVS